MSGDGEGFLSRWSRRKAQARAGIVPTEPPAAQAGTPADDRRPAAEQRPGAVHAASPPPPSSAGMAVRGEAGPAAGPQDRTEPPSQAPAPAEAEPLPTLQDVQRLTPQDDFRPFVRPQVAPEVRNAALRKLFLSDPHFNQMDGLDVYIDDYSKPDPLPAALARRMVAAQFMRLFDEPPPEPSGGGTPAEAATAPAGEAATVADAQANEVGEGAPSDTASPREAPAAMPRDENAAPCEAVASAIVHPTPPQPVAAAPSEAAR